VGLWSNTRDGTRCFTEKCPRNWPSPRPSPARLGSPKSIRGGRARGWLGARRDTSAIGSQRSITDGFEPPSHQDHQGRQNPLGVTYSLVLLVAWWLEIRIQSRRDGTRCFTEKARRIGPSPQPSPTRSGRARGKTGTERGTGTGHFRSSPRSKVEDQT
jgi:hypothetical protein